MFKGYLTLNEINSVDILVLLLDSFYIKLIEQ